jgi:hypothetical protein
MRDERKKQHYRTKQKEIHKSDRDNAFMSGTAAEP